MRPRLVWQRWTCWLSALGLVGGALGASGCGTIEPVTPYSEPTTDPQRLFMRLTLDYPAVTLDTMPSFNTQQLVATPRDALGNAMAGLPAPTFVSSDTTKVKVTAGGLLTAVGATGSQALPIVVTLTVGPVTHADTAWVRVTTLSNPPVLASISLDPVAQDSATVALIYPSWIPPTKGLGSPVVSMFPFIFAGYYNSYVSTDNTFYRQIAARAVSADGTTIDGIQIAYTSLDPAVATIKSDIVGNVYALRPSHPGQVRVMAWTASYGTVKADTTIFTMTWPSQIMIGVQPGPAGGFQPSEIKIRPYGMVFWTNPTADTADVTFDDPTAAVQPAPDLCGWMGFMPLIFPLFYSAGSSCGAGNVLLMPTTTGVYAYVQVRQFPIPGTYPYHNRRTGATGRIIVTNDPND